MQRLLGNELFELRTLMPTTIKIGTRGSKLALWQANWVKDEIEKWFPEIDAALIVIKTTGDKILDVPLAKIGGKGLFVKEIEEALLSAQIDLAVHSMKDMPADLPAGLSIGAVPCRENPLDVLISKENRRLAQLRHGARIGTSSLRRAVQLRCFRPDIIIDPLRGNLDTRLKKLDSENLDAIVLAAAGVLRLGLSARVTQYLDESAMIPAAGQGALCIEARNGDLRMKSLLEKLDHPETRSVVMGERAFLARLGGGCQVPIAAHGHLKGKIFTLNGMAASVDGKTMIRKSLSGQVEESENIGIRLAEILLSSGADAIMNNL
jgi:hydroxymethylbilane synthase